MRYLLVLYLKDIISGVCSPAVLSHLIYIPTTFDVVFDGFWCYFKFLVKQKIQALSKHTKGILKDPRCFNFKQKKISLQLQLK